MYCVYIYYVLCIYTIHLVYSSCWNNYNLLTQSYSQNLLRKTFFLSLCLILNLIIIFNQFRFYQFLTYFLVNTFTTPLVIQSRKLLSFLSVTSNSFLIHSTTTSRTTFLKYLYLTVFISLTLQKYISKLISTLQTLQQ